MPQSGGQRQRDSPMQGSGDPIQGGQAVQQQAGQQTSQPRRPIPESRRLATVNIDEIVQTDVVTATPDTPITTIVGEMAENDVGSVVIVDGEKPVGILTDREIALTLQRSPDISDWNADDIVSRDIVTATSEMNVFDAVRQLQDEAVRRLPIVSDDGNLIGIVTLDDILVLLGSEVQVATSIIKAQSPRL